MEENTSQNPAGEEQSQESPTDNSLGLPVPMPEKPVHKWGANRRFGGPNQPQPSSESKKAGWARRKKNQELARQVLAMKFIGQDNTRIGRLFKDKMKTYFGLSPQQIEELDNEAAIMLRLIGSAIEDGDNDAAREIMDRAYGKATQYVEMKDEDEDRPQLNIQVINVLPSNDQMPNIETSENESIQP